MSEKEGQREPVGARETAEEQEASIDSGFGTDLEAERLNAERREPLPRARELAGPPPLRTAASAPTQFAGEADAEATELQGGGTRALGTLVRKNTLPKARPAEFELF